MDITYSNYGYHYFDLWIVIIRINENHKWDDLMISTIRISDIHK